MGAFSKAVKSVGKAVQNTSRSVAGAVQDAGKDISKGAVDIAVTGFTAPLEYGLVKPVEAIGGKAVGMLGSLAGSATQALSGVQQVAAENPGLLSAGLGLLSGGGIGSLFGGAAPAGGVSSSGGLFTPAPAGQSVPVWVWIVGGLGAVLALFLVLRKKA